MSPVASKNKLREEFISNAVHKFRTSLAVIQGNVDLGLMTNPKMPKYLKDILQNINKETKVLSSLFFELEVISYANRYKQEIDLKRRISKKKLYIARILDKIITRFKPLIKTKNITVIISPKSSSYTFEGDERYIEKMFTNILSNSIKYSKRNGKIEINYFKNSKWLVVKIIDHGIGIVKKDLPHVFERFYRSKNVDRISGSGLGLSIVRSIAEAHKGKVFAESIPGKGTQFTVHLPIRSLR